MKTIFFMGILFCFTGCNFLRDDKQKQKGLDEKLEELVLDEGKTGVEFFTKIGLAKEVLEYRMTYLGSIESTGKVKLKFISSTVYSGFYEDSKKANSIIVIYQDQKRLGYYYVGGGFNKTPIIFKDEIIITYDDDNCDQVTHISFKDSIPNKIFIHCKKEKGQMFGDVYNFEKEDANMLRTDKENQ